MVNGRKHPGTKISGLMGVVIGSVGLLVLFLIIGLVTIYTGAYNVAASEDHASVTRWAFETTVHNSVERRASELSIPEGLSADEVAAGATSYKTMCEHCHGGPGAERAEWAGGMRPRPPHLKEAASEWESNQIFWIVKHGIKMSGMPAFGPTHDDQALWNIAGFVKELPAMTPEEYAALGTQSASDGNHSDHHQN